MGGARAQLRRTTHPAFNAFSTSRWRHIPLNCGSIPDEYADMRGWCVDVQALKSFAWIEFVARTLSPPFSCFSCLEQNSGLTSDTLSPHTITLRLPNVHSSTVSRVCKLSSPCLPRAQPDTNSVPHRDLHSALRNHRAPPRAHARLERSALALHPPRRERLCTPDGHRLFRAPWPLRVREVLSPRAPCPFPYLLASPLTSRTMRAQARGRFHAGRRRGRR